MAGGDAPGHTDPFDDLDDEQPHTQTNTNSEAFDTDADDPRSVCTQGTQDTDGEGEDFQYGAAAGHGNSRPASRHSERGKEAPAVVLIQEHDVAAQIGNSKRAPKR